MRTITEHIRDHLLNGNRMPDYNTIRHTQWSTKFENYMRNRMILGAFRYGLLTDTSRKFDSISSIIKRAEQYLKDGNQEHLVDIANLALVEFVKPACHPNPYFSSVDDGYHTEKK